MKADGGEERARELIEKYIEKFRNDKFHKQKMPMRFNFLSALVFLYT